MAVPRYPDVGLVAMLDEIRTGLIEPGSCRLFISDYTPVAGTTVGDLVGPSWGGYTPQTGLTWSVASIVSGAAVTSPGTVTFLVTSDPGAEQAFGWFILDSSLSTVLFAERFTTPITPTEGVPIEIIPTLRFRNP